MMEHPDYPSSDFLSDFEAANFSLPDLKGTDDDAFQAWFRNVMTKIYPDTNTMAYRGFRLIGVFGNIRGLADYYIGQGLTKRT